MVEPLLVPYLGSSAATVAQLGVPAAINIVSSPIHFLARANAQPPRVPHTTLQQESLARSVESC